MITKAQRSANGKAAKARGAALEKCTLARLRADGCMVERIATPLAMVRGKPRHTAKVFADIIGINKQGRGILVECKNYGRKPRPSDFLAHQRTTLLAWQAMGGVALIAWIEDGKFMMYDVNYVLTKQPKTTKA